MCYVPTTIITLIIKWFACSHAIPMPSIPSILCLIIQIPATSHHFHYHPDLSHRHVLPKLNWAPYFCSWYLKSILCTYPEHLMKIKWAHVTALLGNLSWFPQSPTQNKSQGHHNLHFPLLSDLIPCYYPSHSFPDIFTSLMLSNKPTSLLAQHFCTCFAFSWNVPPQWIPTLFTPSPPPSVTFSVNVAFSM